MDIFALHWCSSLAFNILGCLWSSELFGLFHTSTFHKLVKSALNCLSDRMISAVCMAEIALHCYSGFAFSQSHDALWFILHAELCTDLLQQWQSLLQLQAYCACTWKMCEKMFLCICKKALWGHEHITENCISVSYKHHYISNTGPSFLMTLYKQQVVLFSLLLHLNGSLSAM